MMFRCPVCREPLQKQEKQYRCKSGHSFDIARSGYVNLLLDNGRGRHGDDKKMVAARSAFLEKGFYRPLCDKTVELCVQYAVEGGVLADCGCGECYYTAAVAQQVPMQVYGIDISKAALAAGARRSRMLRLAVASSKALPFADAGVDIVLNLFSPLQAEEFYRVLKPGGILIRAIPLERHLMQLKCRIYEKPYENKPENRNIPGFSLLEERAVQYEFFLKSNEDIRNLFQMTPYYYKTGRNDQAKLAGLNELTCTAAFGLLAYRRNL